MSSRGIGQNRQFVGFERAEEAQHVLLPTKTPQKGLKIQLNFSSILFFRRNFETRKRIDSSQKALPDPKRRVVLGRLIQPRIHSMAAYLFVPASMPLPFLRQNECLTHRRHVFGLVKSIVSVSFVFSA